jgi:hypothetical protein
VPLGLLPLLAVGGGWLVLPAAPLLSVGGGGGVLVLPAGLLPPAGGDPTGTSSGVCNLHQHRNSISARIQVNIYQRSTILRLHYMLRNESVRMLRLPSGREAEGDGVIGGSVGEGAGAVVVGVAVRARARRLEDGRVGRRAARRRRRIRAGSSSLIS